MVRSKSQGRPLRRWCVVVVAVYFIRHLHAHMLPLPGLAPSSLSVLPSSFAAAQRAAFIFLNIVRQYRQAPFTHTQKHTLLLPILRCSASSSSLQAQVSLPLPLFTAGTVVVISLGRFGLVRFFTEARAL